ncbi:MarR family transcriptional regulator [Malaciobacter canalis]|jgi:MarR family 2-MHQ and catechol resistance regulon transcriptional repressor|uniref:MarR family 2-MHQ and catechol resistance regulon transcriptional repressor n=2 Tax=Malaciobacter TaxID=2321114 RepID=A0AB36ZT96_9BACT|nr:MULTISPECIES: MarR family transcriptional regulator [Malaciobacter]PHO08785.1 MarR family transcriptional regulator [Malaciobacter canalis]PPK58989.1 MarR family 2-MHQ and catechol resistance regulon transcriptional repressor [Malaciobacter marinus]QEE31700.1 transcriptional regulator, MarR family [Malaciobacter canalis]
MKNKTTKSYGKRTDKSMKAVVRLERLRLKIHNKTVNYLNNFNLTFNQFKVLEVLYHRGDLNIGSITKLTMSTPGNITVVIKNLKRDGWIASIPDENDKRASILTLTNKGQEVIEEVFPLHAKNLYNWMEVLNDEELDTLYELLNKLYKAN